MYHDVDEYPVGVDVFYTPPPCGWGGGGTHGPIQPIRSPLRDMGFTREVFQVFSPPAPPPIERTVWATPQQNMGFGTTEHVHIDSGREERIKTYFDPVNNKVDVGYEAFKMSHKEKKLISLDFLYPKENL